MSELVAGAVIAGRYELVEKLGHGGMATVWKAEHVAMRAPVALKLSDPELAQTDDARQRFLYEARALAAVRGPHVVQILDFGLDHEWPFIAMELLHGETLGERLDRVHRLTPAQTARIVMHVSRALERAHERGIVHRDLTPHNVFLVPNDDEEIAKVLDFGIAKILDSESVAARPATHSGTVLGTPHYMSPEQAQGAPLDHRSDIWSLGMMTCECLTGRHAFEGYALGKLMLAICSSPLPVPSSLGPVPPGFDAWFARAVTRNVDGRFQSAKQAAQALNEICLPARGLPLHVHTQAGLPFQASSSPSPGSSDEDRRAAASSSLSPVADRSTRSTHPLTSSERPSAPASRHASSVAKIAPLLVIFAIVVVAGRWAPAPGVAEKPEPASNPVPGNAFQDRPDRARQVSGARAATARRAPSSVPVLEPSAAPGFVGVLLPALQVRMDVPIELTAQPHSNRFETRDGSAVLTFMEGDPARDISELFAVARRETAGRSVSYEHQGDTWFVVSGHEGKHIYYEKTLRHEERTTSFHFRFPASQKSRYAPLLEHMEDTFGTSALPPPRE